MKPITDKSKMMHLNQYVIATIVCFLLSASRACPPVTNCAMCTESLANCLGAGLRDIPRNFPRTITTLDLSNNQLTELREGNFPRLPSVQSLRMSGNGFSAVEARAFSTLPQLMSLDLSGNPINYIDDRAFEGLGNIQTLSLTDMKLKSIRQPFKEVPTVSSLNLGYNLLTRVENDDFENNEGIRVLDLSNNRISIIETGAFRNLKALRYLIMKNNPLMEAKNLRFSSRMLQLVDFTNCNLKEVPTKLPDSVADFRLGNNGITEVKVTDFQNMTRLRLVTLNNNNLQKVEYKSFMTNKNLKEIWLSHNSLPFLPRGLPANLMKLYIDYNDVYKIEDGLFDPEAKLEILSLEMNNVMNIEINALKGLKHLKSVNLQGNNIERLPMMTFSDLSNLDTLTLSNNPLRIIDRGSFKQLPSLTTLELSYLRAKDAFVGEDFLDGVKSADNLQFMNSAPFAEKFLDLIERRNAPRMPDVKLLNLQYNELKTLPEKLRNIFTNVKKVYLDGNPWSCDKRLDWLLRWMRETDIEFYSVDPPTCESPASLSGRELTALRSSDLADVKDEDKNERSKGQVQLKQENQSRIVKNPNTGVSVSKTNIPSVLAKLNGSKDAQQTKTNTKTKKGKGRKRKGKGRKRKNRKGKKRNRKRGSKKRRTDKRGKRRITGRTRRKCTKLPDGKRKCCRTMKDGTERCRIRNKRVKKKKAATTPAPVLGNLS